MSKLYSRTMPLISKNSDNDSTYADQFQKNLQKNSVEPYRHDNVYDQINSIINGAKSKYSSVEDAVKDMQERSGLTAHENKMKSLADRIKAASCSCEEEKHNKDCDKKKVQIFELFPQIKSTLDNFIEDTKGREPIQSIVGRIKSIHKKDIDNDSAWDDQELTHYINDKCIEVQKANPDTNYSNYNNLGRIPKITDEDIDRSNQEALHCLNPAVIK